MYKFIALLLITYLPPVYANSQDPKISTQTKQDLKLLKSFRNFSKQSSGDSIITVGDDSGCHFNNIQDAINSISFAGTGVIHVATNRNYSENLVIGDINISIIGGYSDCQDAASNPIEPPLSQISVNGSFNATPTIRITGDIIRSTIRLKNMKLINGSPSGAMFAGGLSAFDANAQVLLENLEIKQNSGAGLAIFGPISGTTNTDIVMLNTDIHSNVNSNTGGGGIYCSGADASIVMGSGSEVTFNQATSSNSKGGGAFVAGGCSFSMYSAEIRGNTANDGGGGIYAVGGARINLVGRQVCDDGECLGDNTHPVRFKANLADLDLSGQGNGGALLVSGSSTLVEMSQVWIDDNTAFHGGAISINDGAQVYIQRFAKNCWNSHIDDKCNLFEANLASSSSGRGGAIYNDNSIALINQSYLENNRADFGTAVYSNDSSAVTVIDGSIFNHNGNGGITFQDSSVIQASGGAEYLINHSTIADNNATSSVLSVSLGSHLSLKNSIVHDESTGNIMNSNSPGSTEFECLIVHDNDRLDGFGIYVDDPEFIDRDNGDYHLNASLSPAVDLCASNAGGNDIDTDLRGWDDPTVANEDNLTENIFDAGADETYTNYIIFKNGFEDEI